MTSEHRRIEFLLGRDGPEATRKWVERTRDIYRGALESGANPASATAEYRALYELAVRKFDDWLAAGAESSIAPRAERDRKA